MCDAPSFRIQKYSITQIIIIATSKLYFALVGDKYTNRHYYFLQLIFLPVLWKIRPDIGFPSNVFAISWCCLLEKGKLTLRGAIVIN